MAETTLHDPVQSLRENGRSFHFASHFLGKTATLRASRLYAYCRYLDDIADSADDVTKRRSALAAQKTALQTSRATDVHNADMLDLMATCSIAPQAPVSLIAGLESDLETVELQTEADLVHYAYRVAGTVGLMMCAVFGVQDRAALPHAIDLGIAMQLTNIARDVGEDARMGRRYLPGEWVDNADPADIVQPLADLRPRLRSSVRKTLSLADRYYASGMTGLTYLPSNARTAIRIAAHVYRAIGREIEKRGHDSWSRRAIVSGPRKVWASVGALMTGGAPRTGKQGHHPELHLAIAGEYGANPFAAGLQ